MKFSPIEILIIAAIFTILGAVVYQAISDDRPIRCFEGYSYRVGSGGELHLRTIGKQSTPVKCE